MFKIDSVGATPDNRFTEGDPNIPIMPTEVSAEWLNMVQDELGNVVVAAQIVPAKGSNAQVLEAVKRLIVGGRQPLGAVSPLGIAVDEETGKVDFLIKPGGEGDMLVCRNGAWVPEPPAPPALSTPPGKIDLLPFRADELPPGWHFCNGDQYELASPVGTALNELPGSYKFDWDITVSGEYISIPNLFHVDGRGCFLRPGATPGSLVQDSFRSHTHSYSRPTTDTTANRLDWGSGPGVGGSSVGASGGAETAPLHKLTTPAIFLGV